ncbi:phage gp36-like protein [Agrobacterium vitis]|nr:phage gp36-like protein [Agrobacterium vitis]MBE1439831.1 phage gp36-like protein [Agrobacterium vitis]
MYATVSNMIARFGETHLIRLSRPEDRTAETVDEDKVNTALADASALIDGYIRGRYFVPIAVPPDEVIRATCVLARYDLAQGEHMDPSDEMAKARKDVIAWLENISRELVNLDVPAARPTGTNAVGSGPRVSDRPRIVTHETLRGF